MLIAAFRESELLEHCHLSLSPSLPLSSPHCSPFLSLLCYCSLLHSPRYLTHSLHLLFALDLTPLCLFTPHYPFLSTVAHSIGHFLKRIISGAYILIKKSTLMPWWHTTLPTSCLGSSQFSKGTSKTSRTQEKAKSHTILQATQARCHCSSYSISHYFWTIHGRCLKYQGLSCWKVMPCWKIYSKTILCFGVTFAHYILKLNHIRSFKLWYIILGL